MKIRLSPIIVAVLIASLILAACAPGEATPTPAGPAVPGDTPAAPGDMPADTPAASW
jgi:hypothetical protein